MSQIEVPDWVVEAARRAHSVDRASNGELIDSLAGKDYGDRLLVGIITAALGDWVVPAGYRVSIPSEPELGHWLEDIGEVTHPDHETHTTLYVLRQEKPE